mmetsp:Transcript_49532/g.92766  ORF Transcript_49532/g.92766 Transcript_49532/m.92766 type:complete len:272 (-) Transcript_49532:731-1546(-)
MPRWESQAELRYHHTFTAICDAPDLMPWRATCGKTQMLGKREILPTSIWITKDLVAMNIKYYVLEAGFFGERPLKICELMMKNRQHQLHTQGQAQIIPQGRVGLREKVLHLFDWYFAMRLVENTDAAQSRVLPVALHRLSKYIDSCTHVKLARMPLAVTPTTRWIRALEANGCMQTEYHRKPQFCSPLQSGIQELNAIAYIRFVILWCKCPVAERHSHSVDSKTLHGCKVVEGNMRTAMLLHQRFRKRAAMLASQMLTQSPLILGDIVVAQ